MPFRTDATLGAGSQAGVRGLIVQDGRRGPRGKSDSAQPPGSHRRRYRVWRDDESRANRGLRSAPGQVPVLVLRSPALLRQSDQITQSDVSRQIRQPVFARFGFSARPLDQQPLLLSRLLEFVVAMCRANAYGGKARAQGMTCAFPPRHGFPYLGRQVERIRQSKPMVDIYECLAAQAAGVRAAMR